MAVQRDGVGQIFVATFTNIDISAAQDLFEIVAPSNSRIVIREFEIGQQSDAGDALSDMLGLLFIKGHTVTGSGGATITPVNMAPWSEATPGATVKRNNTTIASGGTPLTLRATAWNVMGGYRYYPGFRNERITLNYSERLAIRLPDVPGSTITCNATLVFEEIAAMGG